MRIPLGVVSLFFLLIPASLSAQQSTPPAGSVASDPQAVALVQQALTVLTGAANVSDVTLTGTARRIAGSDDETGTATLKGSALGDSRVDLVFPSGNRSEIRNHAAIPLPDALPNGPVPGTAQAAQTAQPVGAWSGPDGVLHGVALHNVLADPTWYFPQFTLRRLANPPYILSYLGTESFGGQQAIHITAAQRLAPAINGQPSTELPSLTQHLSRLDVYLDPATLLPLAIGYDEHPDVNAFTDIPIQIQFSEYQAFQGAQVPRHIKKLLNNGLVLDLQFSGVDFNSGLNATAFQIQ